MNQMAFKEYSIYSDTPPHVFSRIVLMHASRLIGMPTFHVPMTSLDCAADLEQPLCITALVGLSHQLFCILQRSCPGIFVRNNRLYPYHLVLRCYGEYVVLKRRTPSLHAVTRLTFRSVEDIRVILGFTTADWLTIVNRLNHHLKLW